MDSRSDFEYILFDSKNGIRGVKNGREFPISEEEWSKMNPPHRCSACKFVADPSEINYSEERFVRNLAIVSIKRIVGVTANLALILLSSDALILGDWDRALWGFIISFVSFRIMLKLVGKEEGILEIGRFTLPDWSGHSMWYAFLCPSCGEIKKDYVHGHRPYLSCKSCRVKVKVTGKRFYIDSGQKYPSLFAQIRDRIKGIKVRSFKPEHSFAQKMNDYGIRPLAKTDLELIKPKRFPENTKNSPDLES